MWFQYWKRKNQPIYRHCKWKSGITSSLIPVYPLQGLRWELNSTQKPLHYFIPSMQFSNRSPSMTQMNQRSQCFHYGQCTDSVSIVTTLVHRGQKTSQGNAREWGQQRVSEQLCGEFTVHYRGSKLTQCFAPILLIKHPDDTTQSQLSAPRIIGTDDTIFFLFE